MNMFTTARGKDGTFYLFWRGELLYKRWPAGASRPSLLEDAALKNKVRREHATRLKHTSHDPLFASLHAALTRHPAEDRLQKHALASLGSWDEILWYLFFTKPKTDPDGLVDRQRLISTVAEFDFQRIHSKPR